MFLKQISIVNYKNITQADFSFSPKINCFLGNNGMGKTNVLDAVYYLSFCKSFSNTIDNQNIKHEEDFFMMQGFYDLHGKEEEIYCGMKRKQKKQFKRNKKEYERLSDHIGLLPLVMISPEDSTLILGGSEERRRFIDQVIAQSDKQYLEDLIHYNKALFQRNAMLKNDSASRDISLMEILEEQMSRAAEYIYERRRKFITDFTPMFQEYYNFICAGNEKVSLSYESHLKDGNLLNQLLLSRQKDKMLGYTTKGIHKDDLEMLLGEYPLKRVGSQGQNKTYLIALKLSQFAFLKQASETTPILLLDDIFDKIDALRVEKIIRLVSSESFGQIFITDTNRKYLDEIIAEAHQNYHLYQVENGNFVQI
ncbi:MAG: DNA replication and repair protein RecF [Bacteroidales bacterium]|nr:DNA replication and repair protein RecF [Bacteroidales bacterium]